MTQGRLSHHPPKPLPRHHATHPLLILVLEQLEQTELRLDHQLGRGQLVQEQLVQVQLEQDPHEPVLLEQYPQEQLVQSLPEN